MKSHKVFHGENEMGETGHPFGNLTDQNEVTEKLMPFLSECTRELLHRITGNRISRSKPNHLFRTPDSEDW
jgi:hypothetical protein